MDINFRKAEYSDLSLLKYWDTKPHVILSDNDEEWDWEDELGVEVPWREQLLAQLDGRPIGFVQIIDPAQEDTQYWGEVPDNLRAIDIWIGEETDLGKGYGTQMMTLAVNRCFDNSDVTAILIDPLETNTRAHKFYERIGFEFLENRVFGNDKCKVYKLDRQRWTKLQTDHQQPV